MLRSGTDRSKLWVAVCLLVACGPGGKVRVEQLEARIGQATVSAPELVPGARPGPLLRLPTRSVGVPVSLAWRDGDKNCSWSGLIEATQSQDIEIAITGPNLAIIRDRGPGR